MATTVKPMTKAQVLQYLAEKTGQTKKLTTLFLDELVQLAYKEAKKTFTLPGLGKLELVQRKKRKGRNPATGEVITIPAKKVVKFKIAKACKDAVLPAKKDAEAPKEKAAVKEKAVKVVKEKVAKEKAVKEKAAPKKKA